MKRIGTIIENYYKGASIIIVIRDTENDAKYEIEIDGHYDIEFGDEIIWNGKDTKKVDWYSFKLKQTKELKKIIKIKSLPIKN